MAGEAPVNRGPDGARGSGRIGLRQDELDAIVARLQAGEPLDERFRPLLFHATREAELSYSGKATAGSILALTMRVPLQVQNFFGHDTEAWADKLIFGDNLQVLKELLERKARGQLRNAEGSAGVRLCYIDPPFATKRE